MSQPQPFHVALQFGHIKHFNEGLAEFARQLALQHAAAAKQLQADCAWHFHFILPKQWHGLFGQDVSYHDLSDAMRLRHRFPVELDVWHGVHQHMRYRPPVNCKRSVITVHDLNFVYAKQGLSRWWQSVRLTRQLRRADQLVAISQFAAADLRRYLPWAPPATVIHNGVADLTLVSRQSVDDLVSGSYLLHVSRMSSSKNVTSLIEMAAIWPEQLLVLVGPDSPEVERHRQHVQRLGLSNVRFVLDVPEAQKAWLYANCKAFLFPSLMEGFGLPPVEAMQFGKAVVVSSMTSLPEVCGDAAAYWTSFEPHAMRRVVEARLTACEQDARLADDTRRHAAKYDWSVAAASYRACYSMEAAGC